MTFKKTLPFLSLAIVVALLMWSLLFWKTETVATAPGLPPGGDFTLQSASGPVSLKSLRGKVVLLYFGYTSCPDICPTSLTLMSIALSQLTKEEQTKVQGLFVSVDPKRDTPERLAQYSHHFHSNINGITGSDEQVAEVASRYGALYQVAEGGTAMGYTVDHSSVTYVIDQQGKLTTTLPHGALPKSILQEIRSLLNNK